MQVRRRTLPLNCKRRKKRWRMSNNNSGSSSESEFAGAGFRCREPWEVYGYGMPKTELDRSHFHAVNQLIRDRDPDFMSDRSGRDKGIPLKKKTKEWLRENIDWKPKRCFSSPPILGRNYCSPKTSDFAGSASPTTKQRSLSCSSEPLSKEEFRWVPGEDCLELDIAYWEEYDRIYLTYFYDF